ncbi:hypothetical protein OC844_007855 [Tilletia horrida]|nr:hypothetical protein OC844_007855 [Tilletia horrida]
MSAPTAIPAPQHHRQPSFGAASSATSPRISSLGSAAFSFPRTAGTGVTTGPLHSPVQPRLFASTSNSPPKQQQQQECYFDHHDTTGATQFNTHSRAKSASVSSVSTLASSEGPRTPRVSTTDRITVISPNSATASATTSTSSSATMARVPSLALGTYDAAKSRVISQPWAPTLGSRWTGGTITAPPASMVDDDSSTTAAGQAGRLGNLFRKLSLSTSPNLPQMTSTQSQQQQQQQQQQHPHHHHHRHHSISVPSSYQRPTAPPMDHQPKSAMGTAFGSGGSAILTDDLLPSPPAPLSQSATHPIARSEPSHSPVLPSQPLNGEARGRKASISGPSRKRRPSPTGERLLSMGHFGHH